MRLIIKGCFVGCATGIFVCSNVVLADVSLAPVFSNGMVLQRNVPVRIWGNAEPHENLEVVIGGSVATSMADANGRWEATVGPLAAGGQYSLIVTGRAGHIKISDILVGEVWICGGQSNMALGMRKILSAEEIYAESSPDAIRLLPVPLRRRALSANDEIHLAWRKATPSAIERFSAVCYLFGRRLQQHLGVPVGLVSIAVGGTSAETWVSQHALSNPTVQKSAEILNRQINALERRYLRENLFSNSHNGIEKGPTYRPTELFEMMVLPVAGYAARGVVWYQGETHRNRSEYYGSVLEALIGNWREAWRIPKMPFLVVQLPAIGVPSTAIENNEVAVIREAQARVAKLVDGVGLVVTLDCGAVDIHPKNKRPVAERLALAARALAYGENIGFSGPEFRGYTIKGNSISIEFSVFEGRALVAKEDDLSGFYIAGDDRVWVEAHAEVSGNAVVLHHNNVNGPVAARYGWSKSPVSTLFDSDGLPAGPFRTDEW